MRTVAVALSCFALLSCSTGADLPRSPLLDQPVRAAGVVWWPTTFTCPQIADETARLVALSQANQEERHTLMHERTVQMLEWLIIPYYGWVAAGRAGMIDAQITNVDVVLMDSHDRQQELKQFAIAEACPEASLPPPPAAEAAAASPAEARQVDAKPTAPPVARTAPIRPAAAARPTGVAPQASLTAPALRTEGNSLVLAPRPGADPDRVAAEIGVALQPR